MLCPFCQYELDEEKMSCANCGAEYPRAGSALSGARWRSFLVCGGLLIVSSVILVDCVLNHMPGGRDSGYFAPGSAQVMGPRPNLKDPAVQAQLQTWSQNKQMSQNPTPSTVHSH